jgi:membrane protease YdiL (CAAX protease family)
VYLSVAVFLPSLIFGYFRDRYDQLHASIVLHVFYNAGYIWIFASIPTG